MQQQEETDEKAHRRHSASIPPAFRQHSARNRFSVRLEGPKAVSQVVENLFLPFFEAY